MRMGRYVTSVLCCALVTPIVGMTLSTEDCLQSIECNALNAEIQQIDVDDENPHFYVRDEAVYTKTSGYFYQVFHNEETGDFGGSVGCLLIGDTTLDGFITQARDLANRSPEFSMYREADRWVCTSVGTTVILLYSEDNEHFVQYELQLNEPKEEEEKPKVSSYCRYRLDTEASEATKWQEIVYEAQAKIDTVPYDALVEENATSLDFKDGCFVDVRCYGKSADGALLSAGISGFDMGTTLDDFNIHFTANGTYTLEVQTSWSCWVSTIVVTEVDTSVKKKPSGTPLDYIAPELTIDFDDTPKQIGEIVPVTIKSNEPCVFIVDGERYGTSKNMLTDCVFNATYSNTYSVLATDGSDNSTSTQFTVTAFDKAEESGVGSKGRNDNPINESNRNSYWKVAGNLGNVGSGDWGNTNKSASGSMPQTGEENGSKEYPSFDEIVAIFFSVIQYL